MKKNLMLLVVMLLGIGYSHATVLEDSINWGYENGLTKFDTANSFNPNKSIRRDEASKFFLEFANIHGTNEDISYDLDKNCDFYDIDKSYSDLKEYLKDSCRYGFIKGYNNYIMPESKLTNAQAVTIVMRILNGYQKEDGTHWANNYYKKAEEIGLDISSFINKGVIATRGDMITLLYNAYFLGGDSSTDIAGGEYYSYPDCNKDDIMIGDYIIAACNVGSSKPGVSPYDSESYGEYYQRGRNDSTITSNTIFKTEGRNYHKQGPCADGYHVPSKLERDGIFQAGIKMEYWSATDGEAFAYRLNLPFAGYKITGSNTVVGGGDREKNSGIGSYRTSTLDGGLLGTVYIASFGISYNNLDGDGNGSGVGENINAKIPVRCFKNI